MQDLTETDRSDSASGDLPISKRRKGPILEGRFVPSIRVSLSKPRRQPVEISGLGVSIRFGDADNPYYTRAHKDAPGNPRKIQVARNINESALVRLEATGGIDPAQAHAGHMFRALFERMMAGQASPSFIQERVDGGSAPDIFTESRARASRQLRFAAQEMTEAHYMILRYVCGEGRSLNEMAKVLRMDKRSVRKMLKAALDRLAEVWNLAKPKHAPNGAT